MPRRWSLRRSPTGLASAFNGITWDTLRHRNIPAEMQSRASSYDDFASFAAIPAGQLAVVPLAAFAGSNEVALWGGVLFVIVALLPLTSESVRRLGASDPPR